MSLLVRISAHLTGFGAVALRCSCKEGKGYLCRFLGTELRYAHKYLSRTSCPCWHPQRTAPRNAVSLCKEKGKLCWTPEAAIPFPAFPVSSHTGHRYGCVSTRTRIRDCSALEQDLVHPTVFLRSWRDLPACIHSGFEA